MGDSERLGVVVQEEEVLNEGDEVKNIRFILGRGNSADGKYVIVKKELPNSKDQQQYAEYFKNVLLSESFLGSNPPKALITVVGGANGDFDFDSEEEKVFCDGLTAAAKSSNAWIVSQGTDSGVMHYVGEASKKMAASADGTIIPTIGFASLNTINNSHVLKSGESLVEYDATAKCQQGTTVNFNPNFSHFVVVDSEYNNWGQDVVVQNEFEQFLRSEHNVPQCLIVANGGTRTLHAIAAAVESGVPVVIFEGTGKVADILANAVKAKRGIHVSQQSDFVLSEKHSHLVNIIMQKSEHLTLFSPYDADNDSFDCVILQAIVCASHDALEKKLEMAISWDNADVLEHLLKSERSKLTTTEQISRTLSVALKISLFLEKPNAFRFLASRGAKIDLVSLYGEKDGEKFVLNKTLIEKYTPHIAATIYGGGLAAFAYRRFHSQNSGQHQSLLPEKDVCFVQAIFREVDPVFVRYARSIDEKFVPSKGMSVDDVHFSVSEDRPDGADPPSSTSSPDVSQREVKITYTDAMLWAILMGKLDFCKVIWEHTRLPVHEALVGAILCQGLAKWLWRDQDRLLEAADWFNNITISLLEKIDDDQEDGARVMLELQWGEFRHTALELASRTGCKNFMKNVHVQRYLDELLYADKHGSIPRDISIVTLISYIFFPFLLTQEDGLYQTVGKGKWYHFYLIPYTKFWTTTIFYVLFLALLVVVLVGEQPHTGLSGLEIALWIWMIGYLVEEIYQFKQEGWGYFRYTSNQIDVAFLILDMLYIGLSLAAYVLNSNTLIVTSTDILIIITIISFLRLLENFAMNRELGPLYVILQRICWDTLKWIYLFVLFMIGFQAAFMALTAQQDPSISIWTPTLNNGSFMGAYFIIIGDWNTTMTVVQSSWFGAVLVALYAFISQILLVNLLIAMLSDTFEVVKGDADVEWKFMRYRVIVELMSSSFDPPPINLIVLAIKHIHKHLKDDGPTIRGGAAGWALKENKLEHDALKERENFKNLMDVIKKTVLEENALGEDQGKLIPIKNFVNETLVKQEANQMKFEGKVMQIVTKTNDALKNDMDNLREEIRLLHGALTGNNINNNNNNNSNTNRRPITPSNSTSILITLRVQNSYDTIKEFAIVKLNQNSASLIPGNFEGNVFSGQIIQQLTAITNFVITSTEVINMSSYAYGGASNVGDYGTVLFCRKQVLDTEELNLIARSLLQHPTFGLRPLGRLWQEVPDSTASYALFLFNSLIAEGKL